MKKHLVIAAVWALLLGNVGLAMADTGCLLKSTQTYVACYGMPCNSDIGPTGACTVYHSVSDYNSCLAVSGDASTCAGMWPDSAPASAKQQAAQQNSQAAVGHEVDNCNDVLNKNSAINMAAAVPECQSACTQYASDPGMAAVCAKVNQQNNGSNGNNLGECKSATPVANKSGATAAGNPSPNDYCTCQDGSTLGPKAQVKIGATPGANCLKLPVCVKSKTGPTATGCACSADSNSKVVAPDAQVDPICSGTCSGGGSGADGTAAQGDAIKGIAKGSSCPSGNDPGNGGNPAGAPAGAAPAGGAPAGGAPAGGAPGAGGANPAGGGMGDMGSMMMPLMMMGMMAPMMMMPLLSALPTLLSSLTNKNGSGSNNCTSGTGNTATNSGATSGTCSSGTTAAAAGTTDTTDSTTGTAATPATPMSSLESAVTNLLDGAPTTSGTTTPTTATTPVQQEQTQLENDAATPASDTATPAAATDPTQDYHGNVNQTDHRLSCALMTGGSVASCRSGVAAAPAASQ
jgi:hypothetical protein